MPRALITGITGQDGSYLAEWLLKQGYEVHGTSRPHAEESRRRFFQWTRLESRLGKDLFLHSVELLNPEAVRSLLCQIRPDEIYHLAGPNHVLHSFEAPYEAVSFLTQSGLLLLEWIRTEAPQTRFFHASSAEIFGAPEQWPQTETTPIQPLSPYGVGKACMTHLVRSYRRAYGLFLCTGILYNHESPRRNERFVTQKICTAAAAIALGRQRELRLGNLEAERDWGHAQEYVQAMWQMLQHNGPEDYILATGTLHKVRDILDIAFHHVGLDWRQYVVQDPALYRPAETYRLVGNPSKAREQLAWTPRISFQDLIREMVDAALERLRRTS